MVACYAVIYKHHLAPSGEEAVKNGFLTAVHRQSPTDPKFPKLNVPCRYTFTIDPFSGRLSKIENTT